MANMNPGVKTLKIPGRKIRFQDLPLVRGSDVTIKSTVVDSGNGLARTSLIRSGNVVVKKTADSLYYLANDATNGDRNGPAIVTSVLGDGNAWKGATITSVINGGPGIAVTTQAGTATVAAAATDLNANAIFAAQLVASTAAGKLVVKTLLGGSVMSLGISASDNTLFGASPGVLAQGTDADYRVLEGDGLAADMLDSVAVASDTPAPSSYAGAYITAQLLNSTPEALAVLARRGSIFA